MYIHVWTVNREMTLILVHCNMSDLDEFKFLLSADVKIVSKFIANIFYTRTQKIIRKK